MWTRTALLALLAVGAGGEYAPADNARPETATATEPGRPAARMAQTAETAKAGAASCTAVLAIQGMT